MRSIVWLCLISLLLSLLCSCSTTGDSTGTTATTTTTTLKSGWQENAYYAEGKPLVGWQEIDGATYYFDENGSRLLGWQEIDDKRYYFTEDGTMHVGWLEQEGKRYYLKSDGSMARGQVKIEDVNHFFSSAGVELLMVNPWNYIPEGYEPSLVEINDTYYAYDGMKVDQSCYEPLMQMMKDCNANSGARVYIVSAYRTMAKQTQNFNRKVEYWKGLGYGNEAAKKKAATSVAIPGTSEHQLGLALDIVDTKSWTLNGSQANFKGQQWLMEHCWEYGFILRYPDGKLDVTGIIYEPWHYRYVGKEVAAELRESKLTLEEYISGLS